MTCYQAIFLSAKAVLFKDGYREKSHACVARYLEEKYAKSGEIELKWIELLDRYRDLRHDDEYNVFFFASVKRLSGTDQICFRIHRTNGEDYPAKSQKGWRRKYSLIN